MWFVVRQSPRVVSPLFNLCRARLVVGSSVTMKRSRRVASTNQADQRKTNSSSADSSDDRKPSPSRRSSTSATRSNKPELQFMSLDDLAPKRARGKARKMKAETTNSSSVDSSDDRKPSTSRRSSTSVTRSSKPELQFMSLDDLAPKRARGKARKTKAETANSSSVDSSDGRKPSTSKHSSTGVTRSNKAERQFMPLEDLAPKRARGNVPKTKVKLETKSSSSTTSSSPPTSDSVPDIEDCAGQHVFVYRDRKYSLPWMPANFQKTWDNIEQMREEEEAPVDSMGCSHCHDEDELDERIQRLQTLVALMLSSQTRDEINFQAMKRLKKRHLSVQWLLHIDESALANLIKPVSFHNQKAKHLKKVARILREQYDDDIPGSVESLCELPGVGPKMAHLTMKCAWNKVTGMLFGYFDTSSKE
jgi:endonuclease III/predicted transcriptional regulator